MVTKNRTQGQPYCKLHNLPLTKKGLQSVWHKGGVLDPMQRYMCIGNGTPHTLTEGNPSFEWRMPASPTRIGKSVRAVPALKATSRKKRKRREKDPTSLTSSPWT